MVTQEEIEKMSPEEIAEYQKQNCIFCKIIAGEIPSSSVFDSKITKALLDINPATKGHTLVLPKEHFPILPLIPPNVFKQLFLDAKLIATSIKKKTLAGSVSFFVANGAVAGQQSPHFLFHLIPDYSFSLPSTTQKKEDNDALASALQNNLPIMMNNHFKREGVAQKTVAKTVPKASVQQSPSPQEMNAKREKIAHMLQEHADVRELLKTDVKAFQETINQHAQLKQLFEGVDLNALSQSLQSMPEPEPTPLSQDSPVSGYANNSLSQSQPPKPKAEVFLGTDPLAQKDRVFAYFREKPKAQELLINDVETFKELLASRPDIQPIFADVNIEKLSLKLKEAYGGEGHD